jgi:hypothetical protein
MAAAREDLAEERPRFASEDAAILCDDCGRKRLRIIACDDMACAGRD